MFHNALILGDESLPTLKYAPRNFLRHAPNVLLAEYFHSVGLLEGLDIAGLNETDIEPVFEAWQELPEDTRARIDREFQDVHSMSDEHGLRTVREEARYHGEHLEEWLGESEGFHGQALWALIERRPYFEVALQFKQSDELPRRYWDQRNGFPVIPPKDDRDTCDQLAAIFTSYFKSEGRGNTCTMEVYQRDDKYYYFAYVEDHAQTLLELHEDALRKRVYRPAFDVVFIFSPNQGTLETFYQGSRIVGRALQELFARCVLAVELPVSPKDERVYDLDRLKQRGFEFVIDPTMGVQGLRVRQLKLAPPGANKPRWTIDVDPGRDHDAIYDELDRLFLAAENQTAANRNIYALSHVVRAEIRAYFVPSQGRRRSTRTFSLSFPSGCNLDHEGRDASLRQILIDSGIEPRKSTPETGLD